MDSSFSLSINNGAPLDYPKWMSAFSASLSNTSSFLYLTPFINLIPALLIYAYSKYNSDKG